MAEALIEYETLNADQIGDIMEGKAPRPPKDWPDESQGGSGAQSSSEEPSGEPKDKPDDGKIGGPAGSH